MDIMEKRHHNFKDLTGKTFGKLTVLRIGGKNKRGELYMTQKQFISFIKRGFLNDLDQPIQKINCVRGDKGLIIKRFYEFYSFAVSQYSYIDKKQNFIALFIKCFDNWDPKSIEPFFKPNKTKRMWEQA